MVLAMSQVKFFATTRSGIPVEVMAGYDRPLKEFFMTLFDRREDSEEETVWSTLECPSDIDNDNTSRLRSVLVKDFGIVPPSGFWEKVEKREGNVVYGFTTSSTIPRDSSN